MTLVEALILASVAFFGTWIGWTMMEHARRGGTMKVYREWRLRRYLDRIEAKSNGELYNHVHAAWLRYIIGTNGHFTHETTVTEVLDWLSENEQG